MADSLKSAADGLAEQTKKFDIAKYYSLGDEEKARQMVSGNLKDLYIIKGIFSSSSVYGAYIIFFNRLTQVVQHVFGTVSPSFSIQDLDTNVSWQELEGNIVDVMEKDQHDSVLVSSMREGFTSGFSHQFAAEITKLLEQGDAIAINHSMQKLAHDRLGFQNIKNSIDFEDASSLEMELQSKTSQKIDPDELSGKKKADEEEKKKMASIKKMEDEGEEDDPLAGKEVKLILAGSLILSPIKGKDISELQRGDRIKLKLVDKNPKAISLAKAFDAYTENGEFKPIRGRIVSLSFKSGVGYTLFVIVAKGIYIKITEEEENIKVAIDIPGGVEQKESSGMSKPVLFLLVIVFIALVATVFAFLI